jgi:transcriptional regulator with XRE-family HTH domain
LNYFAQNLKYLRKEAGKTQAELSAHLGINRPALGSYEEGRAEPKFEVLQLVSHYFKVPIDDLLEKRLSQNEKHSEKDISGNHLRILPIVADFKENERISVVPVKAAAGYLNGYADPQYVENLPSFSLPLSETTQGTYRLFQIKGDSMLPIADGSYILCQYLQNWSQVKNGKCYVVVSTEEGVVYKRLINKIENNRTLVFHSDNKEYESYELPIDKVQEIWQAKGFLSFELPPPPDENHTIDQLTSVVMQLKEEVDKLKRH